MAIGRGLSGMETSLVTRLRSGARVVTECRTGIQRLGRLGVSRGIWIVQGAAREICLALSTRKIRCRRALSRANASASLEGSRRSG